MNIAPRQLSIVIADDDSTTRLVLRLLLRELGHRVAGEAANGEKAVELCARRIPDLAFLDIHMPRLNGHEAARRIKECNPGIGMIMITSLPTRNAVRNALETGACGFVIKPFSASKVGEAIDNWVRRKPRP